MLPEYKAILCAHVEVLKCIDSVEGTAWGDLAEMILSS